MADLGKAYVQIVPSAEGISGKITAAMSGEADAAGKSSGQTFGNSFASTAKKLIMAAGIGKIISDALNQGGQLEQSLGGVETLFKESADMVKQFASEAYQTTGLSANEYMQNVTGFSASLLQSLGGDTAAAAQIANTAMIDMSDNANKMGTSMESITTAYQGFAKQNYTMLDNLKLGYGGTKSEMERLLADATELTGVQYNISNLSDVYEAIHVIQGELGITGTTALEASTTMEGSFNSMKAAWSDLLGVMATGGDVQTALSNLVTTVSTYLFNNFLPMVGQIVGSVPGLVVQLVNEGLPMLVDQGVSMIAGLADGLIDGLPDLIEQVPEIINGMVDTIDENLFKIIEAGVEIITKLLQGIWDNRYKIIEGIGSIAQNMIQKITSVNWVNLGVSVIKAIASGISALIREIPRLLGSIASEGMNAVKDVDWLGIGKSIIDGIVSGIKSMGGAIGDTLMGFARNAWSSVKGFFGISSPSKLMRDTIGKWIPAGIAEGIEGNTSAVTDAMEDMALGVAEFPLNSSLSVSPASLGSSTGKTTNFGGVVFNISASDYSNAQEIAEEVKRILITGINEDTEVFA